MKQMSKISDIVNMYANSTNKIPINERTIEEFYDLSNDNYSLSSQQMTLCVTIVMDPNVPLFIQNEVESEDEMKTQHVVGFVELMTPPSQEINDKLSGNKRKRSKVNAPLQQLKKRRRRRFISESGFKDGDFHIIHESDEQWILDEGRIEKNKILTELILTETELVMIENALKNADEFKSNSD